MLRDPLSPLAMTADYSFTLAAHSASPFDSHTATLALLELCRSYSVFEFGLGLLASLSPVGLFDVAKWWFTWTRRQPG